MDITNATILITGANRGLGRHFALAALDHGAAKVYATARRPESIDIDGAVPLRLDVTDPDDVAAVAEQAGDVTLLINNAGVSTRHDLIGGDLEAVRSEMDVHYFGTLAMIRAFAPILAGNGGGAIVNVMSALSFAPIVGAGAYAAAKTAEWGLTNNVRAELAPQGTQVLGAFLAATDTDMMAGYQGAMNDPAEVVGAILGAVADGSEEILIDEDTRAAKASLTG